MDQSVVKCGQVCSCEERNCDHMSGCKSGKYIDVIYIRCWPIHQCLCFFLGFIKNGSLVGGQMHALNTLSDFGIYKFVHYKENCVLCIYNPRPFMQNKWNTWDLKTYSN